MARSGAAWLERKSLLCRTVTLKVRYSDFTTITRSHSQLPRPGASKRSPPGRSHCWIGRRPDSGPVRLLGVSVHNLVDPTQPADDEDEADARDPRLPFE